MQRLAALVRLEAEQNADWHYVGSAQIEQCTMNRYALVAHIIKGRVTAMPIIKVKCVLVCGGRNVKDSDFVHLELDRLDNERGPFEVVISGGALGVDSIAAVWARYRHRELRRFPVSKTEWDKAGKVAGPIRNQRMIDEGKPELVLAFPGGRGTADMVAKARRAGIEVIEVKP